MFMVMPQHPKTFQTFQRPAQSSVLNPTELLWDVLECQVEAKASCSTSVSRFTKDPLTEWAQVPTETLQNKGDFPTSCPPAVLLIFRQGAHAEC